MIWYEALSAEGDKIYNLEAAAHTRFWAHWFCYTSAFYSVTRFLICFTCQLLSTPFSPSSYSPEGWKEQKVCGRCVMSRGGCVTRRVFLFSGCYWSGTQTLWTRGQSSRADYSLLASPDQTDLSLISCRRTTWKVGFVGKKTLYVYFYILYDAI